MICVSCYTGLGCLGCWFVLVWVGCICLCDFGSCVVSLLAVWMWMIAYAAFDVFIVYAEQLFVGCCVLLFCGLLWILLLTYVFGVLGV